MYKRFAMVFATVFGLFSLSAAAQQVTVGYQLVYNPWKVAIVDGVFERTTGADIKWVKFDSGAKVITAMASGDVHIALAGSSPIAAGVSRGLPIELFWITEDIASAEALVVRDGSGITAPSDLVGKKIGVPFVSTTHFHVLFALEQFGIRQRRVRLLNLQPPAIVAAWERGDIDAAFVWDPALGRIKQSGRVLITSGQLSSWGKATFDGMVVQRDFARENREFMVSFVRTIAAADAAYRDNRANWDANSAPVRKIVELIGGNPEDVPGVLALYNFPTIEEQASSRWLGGGSEGGAARALFHTAEYLKKEKQIEDLLPDYGAVVNSSFVEGAMR